MPDQRADVIVMGIGLEAEFVFQRYGEGEDQVHAGELCEEIFFTGLTGALVDVHPDVAG